MTHHKCNPQAFKYPCDYSGCEFIGTDVPDIVSHINKDHRKSIHSCQHCSYEDEDKNNLMEHVKKNHKEVAMLNSLFSQQHLFCESFHVFKQDIGNILNTLIQGQNSLQTQLLLLNENKKATEDTSGRKEPKKSGNVKDIEEVVEVTYAATAARGIGIRASDSIKPKPTEKCVNNKENIPSQVAWVGDSHVNSLDIKAFENSD